MEIIHILTDIFRWPTLPPGVSAADPAYVSRLFFLIVWTLFLVPVLHEVFYLLSAHARMRTLLSRLGTSISSKYVSSQEDCGRLGSAFAGAGRAAEHAWHEFSETLVTHAGTVFNTVDAGQFISAEHVRGHWIPPRLIREVPAALTTLGILGTFLGLILGLRGLNIEIGSDEYVRSVDRLIRGIDTAYYTSIWGITASLVFIALERFLSGRVSRAVGRVTDLLNRMFQRKTEQAILLDMLEYQEDLSGVMKSFSTDLSDAVRQSFDEAVQKHLQPPIAEMSRLVTDVANFASSNQAQGVQAIVDSALSKIESAVTDRVQELAAAIQDTVEQNKLFCEALRETTSKLGAATSQQMQAVERYTAATDRLGEIAARIEGAEQAMTNRSQQLDSVMEELSTAAEQLAKVSSQLSVLRDSFESCTERTAQNVSRLSSVWDSQVNRMGQVHKDLTEGMALFSTRVSENLRDSLSQFDEQLSVATRALGVAVKDLEDTLESLGDQLQRLTSEGER